VVPTGKARAITTGKFMKCFRGRFNGVEEGADMNLLGEIDHREIY
jgi:hypothetical protein